ncbi:MAG: ATPase domain-containing protein [Nitrososphaerales archaeon]
MESKGEKLETGSQTFDRLLGGGLATRSVTDVYGQAATGKTQFAFQNAVMATLKEKSDLPVVFVDCAGSFRPERIAEIAETRGYSASSVLDRISTIYVRSVAEQQEASKRILSMDQFQKCRLLVVDDVTTNFAAEFGQTKEEGDTFIERYYALSAYARKLAYIAITRNLAVLLTNSVRSRIENSTSGYEGETTGEIISAFTLFRLHFTKEGTKRRARIVEPFVSYSSAEFSIESSGLVP